MTMGDSGERPYSIYCEDSPSARPITRAVKHGITDVLAGIPKVHLQETYNHTRVAGSSAVKHILPIKMPAGKSIGSSF